MSLVAISTFGEDARVASAQTAVGDVPLTIRTFADMEVDDVYNRVFVSGGPTGDSVEVVDFLSEEKATITNLPGAGGMVLRDEGLYVLVGGAGRIDEFDRGTLEPVASYPIPLPATPNFLALAEDKLWFGTGDCEQDGGTVSSLDLVSHIVETTAPSEALHCAAVVADESVPGALFTFEADFESPNLTRWDVSAGRFDGAVSEVLPYPPSDFAFTPDGRRMLVAQRPVGVVTYDVTELIAMWAAGPTPATAVAVATDGKTFAVGSPRRGEIIDGALGLTDDVFGDSLTPMTFWGTKGSDDRTLSVLPRGLQISDSGLVFGLLRSDGGDQVLRYVQPDHMESKEPTELTVTLLSATRGSKVRVRAESAGTITGGTIPFFLATRDRGLRFVGYGFPNDDGVASMTFRARRNGAIYAAVGQSQETYPSTSYPVRIFPGPDVILDIYGGRVAGRTVVYPAGATPGLQGSVQPARSGEPLVFLSQSRSGDAWVTESRKTFTTDERGLVPARFVRGRAGTTYRVRVEFGKHESLWRRFEFRKP